MSNLETLYFFLSFWSFKRHIATGNFGNFSSKSAQLHQRHSDLMFRHVQGWTSDLPLHPFGMCVHPCCRGNQRCLSSHSPSCLLRPACLWEKPARSLHINKHRQRQDIKQKTTPPPKKKPNTHSSRRSRSQEEGIFSEKPLLCLSALIPTMGLLASTKCFFRQPL